MRRRVPMTPLLVSLGLVTTLPAAGAAQRMAELPAGARVRLYPTDSAGPSVATLVRAGRDTIWLAYDRRADTTGVALDGLERAEVFRGHVRRPGQGLLIGLLAGAVTGALVGRSDKNGFLGGPATLPAVFGVAGAMIGMVSGSGNREVWAEVPLR